MPTHPNILTVDVEEWFSVEALTGSYAFDQWERLPSTLERNVSWLLDLFRRRGARATWFVLGWCAEKHPEVMQAIVSEGHEIACHSYRHRRIDQLTPEQFREDTIRASDCIVKATAVRPRGYRAPSWSINARIPWAFEILADLGFDYDSSIFPVKHDIYGMPHGPRHVFRMKFDSGRYLYEIPASTYRIFGKNIPIAGGGYLRHCPYWYSKALIRRLNSQGQPAVVYVHPWEIDPDPPRTRGLSLLQRLRSYGSTSLLGIKLDKLLAEFDFTTASHYIRRMRRQPIGFQ